MPGGLEYLFGVCFVNERTVALEFNDWWAHDRDEEKLAFEGFIDWVFERWKSNPLMHIYHYAAYEISAVRRLSTRHDTRQDEVDTLLRNEVFVDLYQTVRHSLRIGESSYSIKAVEHLYRPGRSTEVATAVDSIVQYARWMESGQPRSWPDSSILKRIRDYNEGDCRSTAELLKWLRAVADENDINATVLFALAASAAPPAPTTPKDLPPEVIARLDTIQRLREKVDEFSITLADLLDFHRREEKPMWWRMFDRPVATVEELRDDSGCIEGLQAVGFPATEKQSQIQNYRFDPSQECKLAADGKTTAMFTHNLEGKFTLTALDLSDGTLQLKIGNKSLNEKFGGSFPRQGSIIPSEYVPAASIQAALTAVGLKHPAGNLHAPVVALFDRAAPAATLRTGGEAATDAGIRVASSMAGGCLVIQGPPGTGKTFTAAHVINALLASGKRVGVASNSHKAVVNLLIECDKVARDNGRSLQGVKVGGEHEGPLFADNPALRYVDSNKDARAAYANGIIGGTAWLFTLPEWEGALDFLFIDEAGQVSLANAVAMARC